MTKPKTKTGLIVVNYFGRNLELVIDRLQGKAVSGSWCDGDGRALPTSVVNALNEKYKDLIEEYIVH